MPRTLVRLNGNLGTSGQERWSCGFNFLSDAVMDQADATDAAEAVVAAVTSWLASDAGEMGFLLSTSGSLTTCDVYSYTMGGPAVAAGTASFAGGTVGDGAPTCPPQVAAVFSLLTGQAGAGRRGRFYWPALNPGVNGALTSDGARAGSANAVTLLIAIAGALAPITPSEPAVYSPTLSILTAVSAVRGGNVLDTQRRRRDSMVETTETHQYPGP